MLLIQSILSKPWTWIIFHNNTCGHTTVAVLSSEKTLMSSMLSLSLLVSACHLVSGSAVTEMDWLTRSVSFLSDATEPPVSQV